MRGIFLCLTCDKRKIKTYQAFKLGNVTKAKTKTRARTFLCRQTKITLHKSMLHRVVLFWHSKKKVDFCFQTTELLLSFYFRQRERLSLSHVTSCRFGVYSWSSQSVHPLLGTENNIQLLTCHLLVNLSEVVRDNNLEVLNLLLELCLSSVGSSLNLVSLGISLGSREVVLAQFLIVGILL